MPSLLPFMCITWRLLYSSLGVFFFKFGGQRGWIIPDTLKDSTVHCCWDYADGIWQQQWWCFVLFCCRSWRSFADGQSNWKRWLLWSTWFSWTSTATWFGSRVRSRGSMWRATLWCDPLDWCCTWRQESAESCWNWDGWFSILSL